MSLLKSFNFNYLKQNLKKSKGVLAVFLGLIPILNLVVYIAIFTANSATGLIPSLMELSVINFIGLYFIPIVLSVCLFGFVFKKKSVDFVNSMPISRKTIFVTNTIGGILILLTTVFINFLILIIANALFPVAIISYNLAIDYLILWTVSFIFVFTATNLAMTVSGNMITQIVVTMLLLFLVPFLVDYVTTGFGGVSTFDTNARIICTDSACKPDNYYCYDSEFCATNKNLGIYNINLTPEKSSAPTTPYFIVKSMFFNTSEIEIYNIISIVKMLCLSIIFAVIGLFSFNKRKMETSETSFKSIHAHSIIKCLTLIPIILLAINMLENVSEAAFILIVLVVIVAYYFIYDIITKRGVRDVKTSIIYLTISIIVISLFSFTTESIRGKEYNFSVKDIKEVAMVTDSVNIENTGLTNNIFIKDEKLINQVIKVALEKRDYYAESDYINNYFIIKLNDGKKFKIDVWSERKNISEIFNNFAKHKEFANVFNKINTKDVFAIQIGNFTLRSNKHKELVDYIVEEVANKEVKTIYNNDFSDTNIILYSYKNHRLNQYEVSVNLSEKITKLIAEFNNDKVYQIVNSSYDFLSFGQIEFVPEQNYDISEYNYLMDAAKNEFVNYVLKESKEKFNLNKNYVKLSIYADSYYCVLYTNNVEGYNKLIEESRKKFKDSDEYKRMMNPQDGTIEG